MQYREDKYGNKLSVLGFGCMRFQRKAGAIDMEEAEKEILLACENGVNYLVVPKNGYDQLRLAAANLVV